MDSFDFDSLDQVVLKQTLSYLNAFPEPQDHDLSFVQTFNDAVAVKDWLGSPQDLVAGWEGESSPAFSTKFENPTAEDSTRRHDATSLSGSMQVIASPAENQAETASEHLPIKTKFSCTWDGCPYDSSSEAALTLHLEQHGDSVLRQWSQHSSCMWQGCKSKVAFKTRSSYKFHLKNIHTNPLLCTDSKCNHKRPFRNEADLSRHRSTAHSDLRPYICPFENCPEEVNTFARKDKWVKHIREIPHDGDKFCPYYHCTEQGTLSAGFQTREEISKHFVELHSSYESKQFICALGACVFNPGSERWTRLGLGEHLNRFHGMNEDNAWYSTYRTRLEGPALVLRPQDLYSRYTWHDCTLCTQPQLPQQEIQMDEMSSNPWYS